MIPAARAAAAIEVLTDIESRRRPASDAMKDWGLSHRFAGSGDRAAISGLVYDALRKKSSSAWIMGESSSARRNAGRAQTDARASTPRRSPLCSPARATRRQSSPKPNASGLRPPTFTGAPSHVVGDFPEWLAPQLEASFGASAAEEGRALAERAPVDLRVNSLKTNRDKALRALAHLKPEPTPLSPVGLRIAMRPDGRAPPLASDPAYVKGLVELQDEGSQLAALLAEAKPGMQVLDLCAGAGGKTLALAAAMDNQGQIYAADPDAHRLAPIFAQARPLGRAQCPGAGAEGPNGRARRPQRALRSRADRRALHRLRRLAPQSRRQMAHPPWRARTAHQGSGRDARKRAAFRQTGRAHRLHHLLRPARPRTRIGSPRSWPATTTCSRSTRMRRRIRPACRRWPSIARRLAPAFASARERPARTGFTSRP